MNLKHTIWLSVTALVITTQGNLPAWSHTHKSHHSHAMHARTEKMVFASPSDTWTLKGNAKSDPQLFDLTDSQTQKPVGQLVMIQEPYPHADANLLSIDQVMSALQDKLRNKYTSYVTKVLQKSPTDMTLRIQALSDPTLGNEYCLIRVLKGPHQMHVMMLRFKDQSNYGAALAMTHSARIVQ